MNYHQNDQQTPAEPVSPLASATDIACARCQRPNRANCQFCAACGQSLWVDCPSCSSRCAAAEAFCSVCGVNRNDIIQQHTADIEAALEESRQLESKHDYDLAVGVLYKVSDPKHAQLETLTDQVRKRIQGLKEAKEREQTHAGAALKKATALMATHAYSEVIAVLDETPRPFRSAAINELLGAARARRGEMDSIMDQIRETAATHRYMELAPAVEQLLTLQPGHRLGQRLAEQLRERFYRKSKKHLAGHQYDQALKLLAAIPITSQDEKVEQLADQISCLTWMFDEIRNAPVISPTIVALAQRLSKSVPDDEKANVIHAKVQQLSRRPAKSTRFPFPDWSRRPSQPELGCPMKWLAGLRTFDSENAETMAELNNRPGRFFVAIGLALQGLDQTAIKFQLRPPEKQGMFGKLSVGQRKQPAVTSAWGIDLGESGLKAIRLRRDPQSGSISIASAILIEHDNLSNPANVVVDQNSMLIDTLAKFRSQVEIGQAEKICCNLHSQKALGRFLKLPQTTPKKLRELIKIEAANAIPCPPDELILEHHAFPVGTEDAETSSDPQFQRVLLVAAKRHDVRERLRVFEEAEFPVDMMQSDAIALTNFTMHDCLSSDANSPSDPQPLAILDVGTRTTNLVVCSEQSVWFRTLRFGGADFTDAILRPFNLTYEQAEQLKQQPTRARNVKRLYDELDSVLTRFTAEVHRSLASYDKDDQGPRIAQILGAGGGFQLHGLLRRLSS